MFGQFTKLMPMSLHYIVMSLGIYDAKIHLAFSPWFLKDIFIPPSDGE